MPKCACIFKGAFHLQRWVKAGILSLVCHKFHVSATNQLVIFKMAAGGTAELHLKLMVAGKGLIACMKLFYFSASVFLSSFFSQIEKKLIVIAF